MRRTSRYFHCSSQSSWVIFCFPHIMTKPMAKEIRRKWRFIDVYSLFLSLSLFGRRALFELKWRWRIEYQPNGDALLQCKYQNSLRNGPALSNMHSIICGDVWPNGNVLGATCVNAIRSLQNGTPSEFCRYILLSFRSLVGRVVRYMYMCVCVYVCVR